MLDNKYKILMRSPLVTNVAQCASNAVHNKHENIIKIFNGSMKKYTSDEHYHKTFKSAHLSLRYMPGSMNNI